MHQRFTASVIVTWRITGFDQLLTGANIDFILLNTCWLINGISSRTGSTAPSSVSAGSDAIRQQTPFNLSSLGSKTDQ